MDDSNSDTTGVSRRSVLANCGAGVGAGITGMSGLPVAEGKTDPGRLSSITELPEVKAILAELGERTVELGGNAETRSVQTDSVDLAVTTVEYPYGSLRIGQLNDETSVAFEFELPSSSASTNEKRGAETAENGRGARGRPPNEEYRTIPAGTDAWLLASGSETTFLRTATEEERTAVLSSVPVSDAEDLLVYTRSDLHGFRVDVLDPDRSTVESVETEGSESTADGEREFIRYDVQLADGVDVSVASQEVASQSLSNPAKVVAKKVAKSLGFAGLGEVLDSCEVKMAGCITSFSGSIAGCAKCAPACLGSPSGVGIAICFLCVFGVCSHLLSGVSCSSAMDCVENS